MLKVAVINDYLDVFPKMATWSSLDSIAQVTFHQGPVLDEQALVRQLLPYDVIVTERERTHFTSALLNSLPNLQMLVTTGTHNRYIDFEAAAARGILVTRTDAVMSAAPEQAWGLILALTRGIVQDNASIRDGGWQTAVRWSLAGRTLGIVGMGITGKHMARFADVFGMKSIAWSRNMDDSRAKEAGVRPVTLDELLSMADIVTLHVVLSESTRGLIGERELGLMKPTAFLINTSRGPIIDEAALIKALHDGRIAGAGLDVFDIEPLPESHPLRQAPRAVMTPHTGYITQAQYELCFRQAIENILAFAQGAPVRVMTEP